jgi:alpha-glucuronidase
MFGSSQMATRSSIEIEAAQVSAIFRTPGVSSYLSIHWASSVMFGM